MPRLGGPGPVLAASIVAIVVGLATYIAGGFLTLAATFVAVLAGVPFDYQPWLYAAGAASVVIGLLSRFWIERRIRESLVYRGWV